MRPYGLSPVVLDLFCGQGGAAMGYHRAGFDVIGIDADDNALKCYPFDCACLDWEEGLARYAAQADLIHASPPCQRYSVAVHNKASHPDLVGPVRDALIATGKPYVIENVPKAPLTEPITLCGCMFGLGCEYRGQRFSIYRPRLFETTFPVTQPGHKPHENPALPVFGLGSCNFHGKYGFSLPDAYRKAAMGTDWMTYRGTSQAIPPAFTEYIGSLAIGHIRTRSQVGLAA